MFDVFLSWLKGNLKSRMLPVMLIYFALFFVLIHRIFTLQIIEGEERAQENEKRTEKTRDLKSTRGNIYDCNGVLLATNELSYSVTIEDTGTLGTSEEKNEMIYKLIGIIEKNGDSLDCDFEIKMDKNGEFYFDVEGTALLNFKRDVYSLNSINNLNEQQRTADAKTIYEYLRYAKDSSSPKFNISDQYTEEEALKIMAVRFKLFINRSKKYLPITVATNVEEETVATVKENSADLQGVDIAQENYRIYKDSKYFSHIIGYTGTINEEEIAQLTKTGDYKLKYTSSDQIGKTGIEKEYESYLHGTKGYEKVVVNESQRVVKLEKRVEAEAGDDIYLTIDSKLQKASYKMLEKKLAGILMDKIVNSPPVKTKKSDDMKTSIYDVYYAFFGNNIINVEKLNGKKASDLEKKVYKRYTDERKTVSNKLESILAVDSKTTSKDTSEEMAEYLDYIYKFLKKEGILLGDSIDINNSTYKAYLDGKKSLSEFLQYAISNNWVDLSKLDIGDEYYSSTEIYKKILKYTLEGIKKDSDFTKKVFYNLVYSYKLSGKEICLLLFDQDVLEYNEGEIEKLRNDNVSPFNFIKDKIKNLEITPAQLALDPCSGSIVVTDVNTGQVKASVSYPGYDNNKFANKIDTDYYYQTYYDLSIPTMNRVTQQRTAPGSTYKALVSIAALEEGAIQPGDTITDKVKFERISNGPKCHSSSGHGKLDIPGALEVSCNYFFYELGWRLCNNSPNHELGLKKLKKYAKMFGLDAKSGMEVLEYEPKISDSDAIRSAIGQGTNSYTPSQISRYVTTIANKGTCYDLTLIDSVRDSVGRVLLQNKAKVYNKVKINPRDWDLVHSGMERVVNGSKSSINSLFSGLDVKISGKTGTAQESKTRPNHALFISFAPSDNPEISVTAVIPNGYSSGNAADLASNVYRYYFDKDGRDDLLNSKVSGSNSAAQSIRD